MIPGDFEYYRPNSLDEAVNLLATHGDDARVLAGGHSLIPMMKLRLAAPEHLVDLSNIASLTGVSEEGGNISIGAMTTQTEMIASKVLSESCPIIRETALLIADPQVRYCGTLGGNVANGDPGNDMPALMQCLGAAYILQGPDGSREVEARNFYEAAYFTEMNEGEILTGVRFPKPPAGHGYAYKKLKRKVGDYATAAAAVILSMKDGNCVSASIALTNVADTPLYASAAADALVGTTIDATAVDQAVALAEGITEPASDGRGPAEYRTKMAGVMVRRAIQEARERAQ
ncbi:FAD binding domain-containing protein [Denitrobaculum tricleocarpae]|uniref:Xanthine dehydrogenase family protein subunit M n=1 Tax=Denitrobaculum tricleocarpae TaxID=2591009 RepID=A0A545T5L5_9PROT|nr:xanthine dehydrogenase family protein subunit M [Denitrobaculum tricleocarpae]TQV72509.1 xanthine dehydrogenase family protein subunit M [Denitrobaculum tricleocarpae]